MARAGLMGTAADAHAVFVVALAVALGMLGFLRPDGRRFVAETGRKPTHSIWYVLKAGAEALESREVKQLQDYERYGQQRKAVREFFMIAGGPSHATAVTRVIDFIAEQAAGQRLSVLLLAKVVACMSSLSVLEHESLGKLGQVRLVSVLNRGQVLWRRVELGLAD